MTDPCLLGWHALHDDEEAASTDSPWCPALQLDGLRPTFDIWFKTAEECLDWIRKEVLGKDMLPDWWRLKS